MDKVTLERLFTEAEGAAITFGFEATVLIAWLEDDGVHSVIKEVNTKAPNPLREEKATRELEAERKKYPKDWFWFVVISDSEAASSDIESAMRGEFTNTVLDYADEEAANLATRAVALLAYFGPLCIEIYPRSLGLPFEDERKRYDRLLGRAFQMLGADIEQEGILRFQVYVADEGGHESDLSAMIRRNLNLPLEEEKKADEEADSVIPV